MQPRIPDAEQPSTAGRPITMNQLIEAEAHARQAGRLCELMLEPDAQREARILFLTAQRLRARRLAVAA